MATKKINKQEAAKTKTTKKEPEVVYVNKRKPAWRNLWFWLFTVLLASIIFAATYLFGLVNDSNPKTQKILDQQLSTQNNQENLPASFEVSLNKKQVNSIIANYIKNENLENVSAQIDKDNKLVIAGTAGVLGSDIDYFINFDIKAVDGNVILTATDAQIGSADVPVQLALTLIDSNLKAIKNVEISPIDSAITIDTNNIKLNSEQNISFRVDKIDLANDQINLVGNLN